MSGRPITPPPWPDQPAPEDEDRSDIAGRLDPSALGPNERAVFDRWVDPDGHVSDRDIDTLLRQNVFLRRMIADLVASAGRPRPARRRGGYVAEVPTEIIEDVGQHGDYSQIADGEDSDDTWY